MKKISITCLFLIGFLEVVIAQYPNYFPTVYLDRPTVNYFPGGHEQQTVHDVFKPLILEVKQGADGVWYCLVAWNMISIDESRRPQGRRVINWIIGRSTDIRYITMFTPHRVISSSNQTPSLQNYNSGLPGLTDAVAYRMYNPFYGGRNYWGGLVWLPANYLTNTEVGIIADADQSLWAYNIVVPIAYQYRTGFLNMNIGTDFYNLHVRAEFRHIIRRF